MSKTPWVLAAVVLAAGSARADEAMEASEKGHQGQGAVNLQLGSGYRGIFPYHDEYCGNLDAGGPAANCNGRSPTLLGIVIGYGVTPNLEIIAELDVGVERDFGTLTDTEGPRPIALAPGIKGYIAELGPTRLFTTLQAVFDFTSFDQADVADVGIRNLNGLQVDVHHTFGVYAYVGEEVGFRRWLSFDVQAGAGVQARFP